jgi:hypothetical protein
VNTRKPRNDVDVILRGPGDVVVLVRDYIEERRLCPPCQLAIGIDGDAFLTGVAFDDDDPEPWDVASAVTVAAGLHAVTLLLVELRAGASVAPDVDEVREFFALRAATEPSGVELLDHIVICGREWWSLRSLAA